MSIIEKAFAKSYGSYYNTQHGSSRNGLMDLTGCPVFTYDFETIEGLELLYGNEYERHIEILTNSFAPGLDSKNHFIIL